MAKKDNKPMIRAKPKQKKEEVPIVDRIAKETIASELKVENKELS